MTRQTRATPDRRSLPWRDTPEAYGRITRIIHWALAGLILWELTGMSLRLLLGRTPLVSFFVGLHQPLGSVIFVLVILRITWAFMNRGNRPPHGADMLGRAARAGYIALYALMLIVPLLGMLRAWGHGRGFTPFGLEVFAATGVRIELAVAPANAVHGVLAWTLLALISGHVVMAFVHHFAMRDGTLFRISGRARG